MEETLAERLVRAPRPVHDARARSRVADVPWPDPTLLKDERVLALLAGTADHSPYLWGLVEADPEATAALFGISPEKRLAAIERALAEPAADEAVLMRRLRNAKQEAALLIALADLGGAFAMVETTTALSRFADACVKASVRFLLREARASGKLTGDDDASGFFVIALGKHGGEELNYSSDIDLALFFDGERAPVALGVEPEALFVRIGKSLVRLLQERTAEGYVFRVDLRLRPDPSAHAIAVSTEAAAIYYETLGQNWERAAYIKARVVAGDAEAGTRFLAGLTPFVWRKYFDYAAIADIHAMKRQIHAARGLMDVAVPGHDVKIGRGGIREIEFFVQTQQLVFGGRRPSLRGRQTLPMLTELRRETWIGADAERELTEAYVFLRTLEHRLQMVADEQTQRLPVEEEKLKRFAKFCGFRGYATFKAAVTKQMRAVERHYSKLFEQAPSLGDTSGSLVFTGTSDDADTLATLRRMGFAQPEQAAALVRGWHFGHRAAVSSPKAREALTELTPALLGALAASGDANAALNAFDGALSRMPASVEFLSILRGHPKILALLGDVLGGAPALADVVARSPHVLDAAIDLDRAIDPRRSLEPAEIRRRAERALQAAGDDETKLNLAREFLNEERFLIGLALFADALDADTAARAYSALAEGLLGVVLDLTRKTFAREHGEVAGATMAVLALGKLGSREMTAASDLDLIVLHDFPDDAGDSDGRRVLPPGLYFARLTQRFISALTAPMRAGVLYDVDMRLRPSGGKGPLATSLSAFAHYQETQAWTWEQMALSRARVVAGDEYLIARTRRVLTKTLRAARDAPKVFADVAEMRRLLASERRPAHAFDLKLADGGLIDLEFIAQTMLLAHAHADAHLLSPETREVLRRLGRAGFLPPEAEAELGAAHELFTAVTQFLRLSLRPPFDPASAAAGIQRRLAAACNAPDLAVAQATIAEAEAQVRRWREALLGIALP